MTDLNESGMVRHDLDHLILPLLDIDTFESKIDNSRAIVVAFYVFEHEPAKDLEVFISRSNFDMMDVETSPAPTTDGYYVVFLEIERNDEFPGILMGIIEEINNLTDVKEWRFKGIGSDKVFDLNEDTLTEQVNLDPDLVPPSAKDIEDELDLDKEVDDEKKNEEKDEEKPKSESAIPMLQDGLMESIRGEGDIIMLNSHIGNLKYKVLMVSETEPSMPVLMPMIGDPMMFESFKLAAFLGNSYRIDIVNDGLLISCDRGHLLLEPIDR